MAVASDQFPNTSKISQAESNDPSKRSTHANQASSLYARLRRLEQRVVELEKRDATRQRDLWRIEKAQSRSKPVAANDEIKPDPGGSARLDPALFGG